jgi:hypothetical protein
MGDPIIAVVAVALITLLCDGKKKQREHDRPLSATGFSQVVPGETRALCVPIPVASARWRPAEPRKQDRPAGPVAALRFAKRATRAVDSRRAAKRREARPIPSSRRYCGDRRCGQEHDGAGRFGP